MLLVQFQVAEELLSLYFYLTLNRGPLPFVTDLRCQTSLVRDLWSPVDHELRRDLVELNMGTPCKGTLDTV